MKDTFLATTIKKITFRQIATIFTLIAALISIYVYFFDEKEINLQYEIVSNTNVLDFNADVTKLEVKYDSTNLKQTNQNLRIFTVKIINNGNQDLLIEHYDSKDPIGLKLDTGEVIESPELIQSSSDYIKRNLKITKDKNGGFKFSQIILEPNEYYLLKLLVLHKKGEVPKIKSYGKIAGQKEILITNTVDVSENKSLVRTVFEGNIWAQLLKSISYFLMTLITILFFAISISEFQSFRDKEIRKKLIKEFKNLDTYTYKKMDDVIFDNYKKNNSISFGKIKSLLKSEKKLNKAYKKAMSKDETLNKADFRLKEKYYSFFESDLRTFSKMIHNGFVFINKDELKINKPLKNTLKKFIEFLKEKGKYNEMDVASMTEVTMDSNFD